MSRLLTPVVEDASGIALKVGGTTMLNIDTDGISRPNGTDAQWFVDLFGDRIAVGGQGALAQATLTIGSFRIYNAWELINHASNSPYLEITFFLPPDYDGRDLKITLFMVRTATATGTDIDTRCRLGCVEPTESLDVTVSSAVDVVTTTGANNTLFTVEHTVSPAGAAAGALCHGYIQRVPSVPADDYTGSVYLIGARVEYA